MARTHPRPMFPTQPARRRRRRGSRPVLILVAVLGLALLGGGVAIVWQPQTPAAAAGPPTVAALVGPDASNDAYTTVVKAAAAAKTTVLVGPLQGGGQPYTVVDTRPTGDDQLAQEQNAAAISRQLRDTFRPLSTAPQGPDVLDGLNHLGQQLAGRPHGPIDLLLSGNALQIGAGVDLTDPVQRGDVPTAVARLTASPLPDLLGARVYMVGATMTAGRPLDSLGDLQVREIYRQVLQAAHATLVLWNDTQLSVYPTNATVAPARFPGHVDNCDLTIRLGSGVLFDTNSATLKPDAAPLLEELLLTLTQTHPDAAVDANGYTDSRGTAAHNSALSQRRAEAVTTWLEEHGVAGSRLTPTGYGESSPIGDNSPRGQALNRRVELILHLTTTCPKGASS